VAVAVDPLVVACKPTQSRRRTCRGDRPLSHPEDALGIDDGAEDQNTMYSNVLINESGQEISLDNINNNN
jgi:hypothetical protein